MTSVKKDEIKPVHIKQILNTKCLVFLDFLDGNFWSIQKEESPNKD